MKRRLIGLNPMLKRITKKDAERKGPTSDPEVEAGIQEKTPQYQDPSWYDFPRPSGGYYGDRRDQWGPPPPSVAIQAKGVGAVFPAWWIRPFSKVLLCTKKTVSFSQSMVSSAELSLCCESADCTPDKELHLLHVLMR